MLKEYIVGIVCFYYLLSGDSICDLKRRSISKALILSWMSENDVLCCVV